MTNSSSRRFSSGTVPKVRRHFKVHLCVKRMKEHYRIISWQKNNRSEGCEGMAMIGGGRRLMDETSIVVGVEHLFDWIDAESSDVWDTSGSMLVRASLSVSTAAGGGTPPAELRAGNTAAI